jgi:hypothetical protein
VKGVTRRMAVMVSERSGKSGIDFAICHVQSAVEAPIFKNC